MLELGKKAPDVYKRQVLKGVEILLSEQKE